MSRPKSWLLFSRAASAYSSRRSAARGEDVVAHRGVDLLGAPRDGGRVRALFVEAHDAPARGRLDDAELGGVLSIDGDGRHGDLRPLLLVVLDHAGDVHPIDVIGPEDRHQVGVGLLDQVDVLVDGVRRALIPGLVGGPHLRGHGDDEAVLQDPAELPAVGEVLEQRLALELGEDVDRVDARVDEVAEDEVDDAVLAAERNGRLGALLGEGIEASALPSGENDAEHAKSHGAEGPPGPWATWSTLAAEVAIVSQAHRADYWPPCGPSHGSASGLRSWRRPGRWPGACPRRRAPRRRGCPRRWRSRSPA